MKRGTPRPVAVALSAALCLAVPAAIVGISILAGRGRWHLSTVATAMLLLAGAAFAVYLALVRRARLPDIERLRRFAKGLCVGCGYDLRKSEGRCPECGKPIDEMLYRGLGSSRRGVR